MPLCEVERGSSSNRGPIGPPVGPPPRNGRNLLPKTQPKTSAAVIEVRRKLLASQKSRSQKPQNFEEISRKRENCRASAENENKSRRDEKSQRENFQIPKDKTLSAQKAEENPQQKYRENDRPANKREAGKQSSCFLEEEYIQKSYVDEEKGKEDKNVETKESPKGGNRNSQKKRILNEIELNQGNKETEHSISDQRSEPDASSSAGTEDSDGNCSVTSDQPHLKDLPSSPLSLEDKLGEWQMSSVPRILCTDSTIKDLHTLVNTPVPQGEILRCEIEKVASGTGKERFSLTIPNPNKGLARGKAVSILIAQKCNRAFERSKYIITLKEGDFFQSYAGRSKWYFGKLVGVRGVKSKLKGKSLQYILYDKGLSQKKLKHVQEAGFDGLKKDDMFPYERRNEILSVLYSPDSNAPKTLHMTVATVKTKTRISQSNLCFDHINALNFLLNYPTGSEDSVFLTKYQTSNEFKKLKMFRSLSPVNNKHLSISSLARYPVAPSVKNYELVNVVQEVESDDNGDMGMSNSCTAKLVNEEKTSDCLQKYSDEMAKTGLARIGTNRFCLVVRSPFTVYEAFAIALSRFDATKNLGARISKTFQN